jgi:predicted transcriptional regulator
MDVDGIEHLILKGGAPVLRNIKGILIEINEEFEKQAVNSARCLSEAGLVLKEKRQSDMFKDGPYQHIFNQIWYRPQTQ